MKAYAKTIAVVALATSLAACSDSQGDAPAAEAAVATAQPEQAPATTPTTPAPPASGAAPLQPLTANAPAFASLYPDATLLQAPVIADGADGPGGMAEFTVSATPEQIVEHYRQLADKHGLDPVMAMNQGNARAFAALNTKGAEVQVVASPDDQGITTVHLTWKSGR